MRMKNEELGHGIGRVWFALIFFGVVGVLFLGGCASTTVKSEVPFGTETAVDPFIVSTEKTGEGEILLVLSSSASEEMDVDIRMRRTEIGFDYGRNPSNTDPKFYSQFEVDKPRRDIAPGAVHEFSIRLKNLHEVSRPFYTIVYIMAKDGESRWKITVRVGDDELFSDIKYLRQLNKTDYWHPRIIRENWEKYLQHIGK